FIAPTLPPSPSFPYTTLFRSGRVHLGMNGQVAGRDFRRRPHNAHKGLFDISVVIAQGPHECPVRSAAQAVHGEAGAPFCPVFWRFRVTHGSLSPDGSSDECFLILSLA